MNMPKAMREGWIAAIVSILSLFILVTNASTIDARARANAANAHGEPFGLSVHGSARTLLFSKTLSSSFSKAPSMGFTVADFTGDTHPDLATVELNRLDSSSAQYWIAVRLSEGTSQILTLTAPFESLEITARDVTGDGNLDLVVRTARSWAPVALFLNDGSGHFFASSVSAFANAFRNESSHFQLTASRYSYEPTMGCTESHAAEFQIAVLSALPQKTSSRPPASFGLPLSPFLSWGSNRAPPATA